MDPRSGLDGRGKSSPIGIRSADRLTRGESVYQLSYPGGLFKACCNDVIEMTFYIMINYNFLKLPVQYAQMGCAVAQLVETLRYKPEGRGFDSGWSHSLT